MNLDEKYVLRAIKLAEKSIKKGESPFGCVIVKNDKVISEAHNETIKNNDATLHAEIIAIKKAQKKFSSSELSICTIYTNCEPCAMCSFMIRELKFKKVVFGIYSPIMGGFSKWNILQDNDLASLAKYYSNPPEIIGGVLENEAAKIFLEQQKLNVIKKYN